MMSTRTTVVAAGFMIGLCGLAAADCLKYEPVPVTLRGQLILRTFPGAPNYRSVKQGDRVERVSILLLDEAVCVEGDPQDDLNSKGETGQLLIQVVTVQDLGVNPAELAGQRVVATGTLFGARLPRV